MPFEGRIAGTGLILIVGIQGIYYGMKFNGSAHPRSPVWHFVKGLHDFTTYGALAALGVAFTLFVVVSVLLSLISDHGPPKPVQEKPVPPTPEQLAWREQHYREQIEKQEYEKKRLEEIKRVEEQLKQEAIKAREARSATDATHAALDDFL